MDEDYGDLIHCEIEQDYQNDREERYEANE